MALLVLNRTNSPLWALKLWAFQLLPMPDGLAINPLRLTTLREAEDALQARVIAVVPRVVVAKKRKAGTTWGATVADAETTWSRALWVVAGRERAGGEIGGVRDDGAWVVEGGVVVGVRLSQSVAGRVRDGLQGVPGVDESALLALAHRAHMRALRQIRS